MQDGATRRFWTVPNVLSLSRLALIPLFLWLMAQQDRRYWVWGGVLIIYGIVSDLLDGYIARRFHQTSEFGKILDPLADKVTTAVVAIFCVVQREMPWAALAIALIRDVGLLIGGRFLWRAGGGVPTSNTLGKIAAFAWGVTLLFWIFDWRPFSGYLLWPAVGLYVLAGVFYARRVMKTRATL